MVKVAIDKSESEETDSAPVRRKSRWKLKLFVLLLLTVAVAPSLLSYSGQVPAVLKKLHPGLAGAVKFQSVTLHWWAPVDVTRLKVRDLSELNRNAVDSDSAFLCEAERITTLEPLWRIVLNGGRGTGIVVTSPRLNLIADESGTNIDRTLTAVFGKSAGGNSDQFPFRIILEDGEIVLRSVSTPTPAASDTKSVQAGVTSDPGKHIVGNMMPVVAVVSEIKGTFSTMDTQRRLPEMALAASITSGPAAGVTRNSRLPQRSVHRATRLAAGLDDVVSDFPDVPLEDLAGIDESADATAARIQIRLQPRADEKGRQTIQIGARAVDLRLVQPFLSMLGLEASCEGTISGGIDARLAGATLSEGLVGRLLLKGDAIRVRQHMWAAEEWLHLGTVDATGALAIADDGMLIQDLNVQTEVAELTGSGELRHVRSVSDDADSTDNQQLEVKGSIDLALLASSLRKTLAIHDDVTIRHGRLTFGVRGSTETADDMMSHRPSASRNRGSWQFVAKTEALEATRAGKPLKVDSSMRLDAAGHFADGVPELLKAGLTADFGTVDCSPDGDAWKLSGLVRPESLWQQLQQFADVPETGLHGDVSFQSRIALKGPTIQLTETQLTSSDVQLSSVALDLTPSNPLTSMLDGTIHVSGSGAAIRTVLTPWHDASWLAQHSRVVGDLSASPRREIQLTVRISPENVAAIQRQNVLSVSRSTGRTTAANGSAAASSAFAIDEADVALSMSASSTGRRFDISNGTVRIPGVTALLTGSVAVPEGQTILDLTVDATYDLDQLSRRLFAADSGLSFSGQGRDTFKLSGSPSIISGVRMSSSTSGNDSTPLLSGSGGISWTSANIRGLQIGAASLQATLQNSLIRSAPMQCSLNGGELSVMPQYDLASSRLQLGSGSRIENLQLTQELCRTWLGYVAPMMADSTDVTGVISARVERFMWDINLPENSDVAAQLTIHQAQASPGSSLVPLLEVIDLLRRRNDSGNGFADRSMTLPEQSIPVQVRQGMVIHDGLIMDFAGYRLKTSGSVGMNKQLQMTLDVPLDKNSASGNARTVKVPLRGTIASPQPDTKALLQNLGTHKIQEEVGDQVDKVLNKQLKGLLDKF